MRILILTVKVILERPCIMSVNYGLLRHEVIQKSFGLITLWRVVAF
jgi:hypothetical protein